MKKQMFVMLGIIVAVSTLSSIRTVTSQASCSGQYNLQIKGDMLPETAINGTVAKVFVLPEVNGLQKVYQSFAAASIQA